MRKMHMPSPKILTIGTFDGIHLGHQSLLNYINTLKKQLNAKTAVLTFSNHPAEILRPQQVPPLLCSIQHKIKLLNEQQFDSFFLIPFTKEFSQLEPEEFLLYIRKQFPFSHLVLGHDAKFGKEKKGDHNHILHLARTLNFQIEYISEFQILGQTVSSTKIRESIQQGNLKEAEIWLGRKFSIYGKVLNGQKKGKLLGFPTVNLDLTGLCIPPLGVYIVQILAKGNRYNGVANIGIAPTLRIDNSPLLEAHLFSFEEDLYGENIEVQIEAFIRPEKKFASVEDLKKQISADVEQAKHFFIYSSNS